jgi:alpha-mannosidase
MAANAHMDTQWRWTVQQVIGEFLPNTMLQNFKLMEDYPDYKFSFEGAVKYLWTKEYYPDMYEKLKHFIADGQWYPAGASWDANDYNVPSAESNFRNILLAEEFYKQEFGIKSYDIMLPDCFGFGFTLPTIAANCGVIGFHTQKLTWRYAPLYENGPKWPFEFGLWKGVDGEEILMVPNANDYGWNPKESISNIEQLQKKIDASPVKASMRYFGTRSSRLHGDQGGSPLPDAVKTIHESILQGGPYRLRFAATDDIFKDFEYILKDKDQTILPTWNNELLIDTHSSGGYTSNSDEKRLNRRSEQLGAAAEGSAAIADYLGVEDYPHYMLTEAYRRFIWHQFHDDLPGTCIPEAYTFSWNDQMLSQNQFALIETGSVSAISEQMDTRAKGTSVVVFNPVTYRNEDLVTVNMPLSSSAKDVQVIGADGKKVRTQLVSHSGEKATVLIAGSVPSMGMTVLDVRPAKTESTFTSSLKVTANTIENKVYKVTVNENGDICSIVDKRYGREMVKDHEAFALKVFPDDVSDRWPAWEIRKEVVDSPTVDVTGDVKISKDETGPLRASLKVERRYGESTFTQWIILTDGACDDRIDIKTDVDWKSGHTLLKAAFPFSFTCTKANYDLGLGHITRGTNSVYSFEVPAQQWADATADDQSYGVTIMNDCKYGWDKPDDNTLRLTLLHTPTANHDYGNQKTQDIGPHEFTYSIVGHAGTLQGGVTATKSDILNQRKAAFMVAKHSGPLGKSFSMVETSAPGVRVKCFKQAEDGRGLIVRVYELDGKEARNVKVHFAGNIVAAEEDNGIEEYKSAAVFEGKDLMVNASPFSPHTYRVQLAPTSTKPAARTYTHLEFPLNRTAFTSDAFSAFGHMDPDWHSFAAELIPDTLVCKGVPFTFYPADSDNSLACEGQTLKVPEGSTGVYMLVASSRNDTTATFTSGDLSTTCGIPYYSGFFGQGNWKDLYKAYLKEGDVAYVGSHRHDSRTRNEPYVHTYMFMIYVPVGKGTDEIVLPDMEQVTVFSATAVNENETGAVPITDMVIRLKG